MAEITTLNANELTKNIRISVSIVGCTKFRFRVWVGSLLIRLGIRVIGADGKVEFKK